MGKRKLHETNFYQCDWTGFAMLEGNCYMPSWTLEGKLIKKGSYCNWESVIAHAEYIYDVEKQMEECDLQRIVEHINQMTGETVNCRVPHFTDLEHVKCADSRALSADQYHEICCQQVNDITAVLISETGDSSEVVLSPSNGSFSFGDAMPAHNPGFTLNCFQSYRKKNNMKELSVMYFDAACGFALNTLASSMFKMQIFGPVLMVQHAKEPSFKPRTRYISFTAAEFEEVFTRKRKKVEQAGVATGEYKVLKTQMQSKLAAFEAKASARAKRPSEAKTAPMPAPSGVQLAALVKEGTA